MNVDIITAADRRAPLPRAEEDNDVRRGVPQDQGRDGRVGRERGVSDTPGPRAGAGAGFSVSDTPRPRTGACFTAVSDAGPAQVIEKFLTQDETHNNLVVMTKEAQVSGYTRPPPPYCCPYPCPYCTLTPSLPSRRSTPR